LVRNRSKIQMMGITRHFSGGEEPWQLRESSVGGGIRARALAEFIVIFLRIGNENSFVKAR